MRATRPTPADEELMVAYREGDEEAFTLLFERYKTRLFNYFFRHLGIRALAEDLLQSTFLNVHRSRKSYQPWQSFSNLLKRKKGLKKAFERVALPELSNLYAAGYYLTKSEKQAEELVEETYLRAFRHFKTFTPDTNCRAWLLSILRDLFMTRHRTRKTEPESVDWERAEKSYESLANEGDKVAQFFSGLQSRDIDEALKTLPEELRMAITLVDVEELSYQEAARVMECPIATIRSRMSRARRVFQVALKDYAEKRSPSGRYPLQLKQISRG